MLQEKLTILVCSCDNYADLWHPFFLLLKKYWDPRKIRILLNTESRDFSMDGLDIECIHSPNEKQYGQRMLNALSHVKTEYVLLMLDDFFLRQPVDEARIAEIIRWMDQDHNIVYFNCDPNSVYADWEVNKYPGFRRIPPGNPYTLSMQAAIWRTASLKKSWLPGVNPWEWERLTNVLSYRWRRKKFYCSNNSEGIFLDYGHYHYGDIWGVYRGKWYLEDVEPLFKKENILVDFSIRNSIIPSEQNAVVPVESWGTYEHIGRCLGKREIPRYYLFNKYCQLLTILKKPANWDYFKFLQNCAQKRFLRKHPQ